MITVLSTHGPYGYEQAIAGARLSYNSESPNAEADLRLARALSRRSRSERKFLRQIVVWTQIKGPRYWWQEFATYRFGVEVQSQSTMHTLLRVPLVQEDFAFVVPTRTLEQLNQLRVAQDWARLKGLLPEGYLQTRAVMLSYEALRTMYADRREHKLIEWQQFCTWIATLPMHEMLTVDFPLPLDYNPN